MMVSARNRSFKSLLATPVIHLSKGCGIEIVFGLEEDASSLSGPFCF